MIDKLIIGGILLNAALAHASLDCIIARFNSNMPITETFLLDSSYVDVGGSTGHKKYYYKGMKLDSIKFDGVYGNSNQPIYVYDNETKLKGDDSEAVLKYKTSNDSIFIDEYEYEMGQLQAEFHRVLYRNTFSLKSVSYTKNVIRYETQVMRNDSILVVDSVYNEAPDHFYLVKNKSNTCELYYGDDTTPLSTTELIKGSNDNEYMILHTEDNYINKEFYKQNSGNTGRIKLQTRRIINKDYIQYNLLGRIVK